MQIIITQKTAQELVAFYLKKINLTVQDIKNEGAKSIYDIFLIDGIEPSKEVLKELQRLEQE